MDLIFGGVAGLCGSVMLIAVNNKVSPRAAVVICALSGFVGFVLGGAVGDIFGISKAAAGFMCGVITVQACLFQ